MKRSVLVAGASDQLLMALLCVLQLKCSNDGFSVVADYFGRGVFNKLTLITDLPLGKSATTIEAGLQRELLMHTKRSTWAGGVAPRAFSCCTGLRRGRALRPHTSFRPPIINTTESALRHSVRSAARGTAGVAEGRGWGSVTWTAQRTWRVGGAGSGHGVPREELKA